MMRKDGRSILRVLAHHGIGVVIALGIMGAVAGAQAATVKIKPDEVKIVRLSERPATVVVGNPLYADVMVVGNQILVQGQNYGKTSVIVMNNDGIATASSIRPMIRRAWRTMPCGSGCARSSSRKA